MLAQISRVIVIIKLCLLFCYYLDNHSSNNNHHNNDNDDNDSNDDNINNTNTTSFNVTTTTVTATTHVTIGCYYRPFHYAQALSAVYVVIT